MSNAASMLKLFESEESRAEIPPVEIREKKIEEWHCPHCGEELHEKGDHIVNLEEWKNGEAEAVYEHHCGGRYVHPPMSEEQKSWLDDLMAGNAQFGTCPPK